MKSNIAIFPAGTEIGLEINRALRYSTYLNVYGFSSLEDHAKYIYENYIGKIPFYNEEKFLTVFNEKLKENEIKFIYPAHDDVQLFLTRNAEKLAATVLTSPLETVEICRSKSQTYNYFENDFFIPKTYKTDSLKLSFPIFAKPDVGQGAKGVKKILDENELENYTEYNAGNMILCEYLPGEEYTIDCFTDNRGNILALKQRERKRIKTGIAVNSKIIETDEVILEIANIINSKLKFKGAWFFQVKKDVNGQYKLLEIAPRVSGTMGLSRNTGINYPLLTIFINLNIDVEIIENKFDLEVDRAFINRYSSNINYHYIYVDLDDTLIINNKVNAYLMMFLYQAVSHKKKILLITKHKHDVNKTLNNYLIPKSMFSKVIHITNEENKSDFIHHLDAIFIDDSFAERLAVAKIKKIPVFDCSEIESLVDWRNL